MTYYAISALINASAGLSLGLFALYKNPKAQINRSLFFWCFTVSFWSAFYFIWQLEDQESQALLWTRLLMLGAVWVPVAYLRVVLFFLNIKEKYKYFLYFNYALSVIFSALLITPFMVDRVEPMAGFLFWPKPGLAYAPFLAMFLGVTAYSAYLSYKALETEQSLIKKSQIKYMLFGIVISIIAGSTNYFLWYNIPIKPYGNLFASTYVVFTVYAILRYRLMDIRLVLGRGAVYLLSFSAVLGLAFLLTHLNERWIKILPFPIAAAAIIILTVVLFQTIFRFFEKLASKYFYYTFYSYQTVLTDLGRSLTQVLDLDRLGNLIIVTLIDTMKLDKSVILLKNPRGENYVIQENIGFQKNNGISLIEGGFLTEFLQKTQKVLVYEEIALLARDASNKSEKENLEELKKNMKKIEASLCLPLLSENEIFGIIVLGKKISQDPYSSQDIDLLENLANQASVAIQNAKLYSEMKDFNLKLESEVEKRTKELQKAYNDLQKLDKAKSEFLSIASHQLRTPLTAIKGYISMILENTFGKPDEKMQKPLENIYTSNERLIKLVNDLLNISRIEAGRLEMKLKEADLTEMISSILKEFESTLQTRKIRLKFIKPASPLSKVVVDADKIRQALMNIVDNAMRYTKKGSVTIKASLRKDFYRIEVADTGEGMIKEDIDDLFDSFSRGRVGNKLWTEGMGIGLHVAKKFIDLHNGRIWAESKGKDKGSTFFIELPLKNIRPQR